MTTSRELDGPAVAPQNGSVPGQLSWDTDGFSERYAAYMGKPMDITPEDAYRLVLNDAHKLGESRQERLFQRGVVEDLRLLEILLNDSQIPHPERAKLIRKYSGITTRL